MIAISSALAEAQRQYGNLVQLLKQTDENTQAAQAIHCTDCPLGLDSACCKSCLQAQELSRSGA